VITRYGVIPMWQRNWALISGAGLGGFVTYRYIISNWDYLADLIDDAQRATKNFFQDYIKKPGKCIISFQLRLTPITSTRNMGQDPL